MQPDLPTPPAGSGQFRSLAWLLAVLIAAAIPRLIHLAEKSFTLDEAWAVEIATGRGSLHQHLPLNQVIAPPPPFYSLDDAPPFWQIWTHMQVTHPPLYSILLRWWEDLLGDTDALGRLFAVAASLISIALLFDTVRLHQGLAPAVWASLLMSFAGPQLEYARSARSYTLLIAAALLAVNMIVRIHRFGFSPRRRTLLLIAIFSTLMIHYFCLGAVLGLFAFSIATSHPARRKIIAAFLLSAAIFAIVWAPFMWRQRHLFATDDPSTLFLSLEQQHHLRFTLLRIAVAPIELFGIIPDPLAIPAAIIGSCLYLIAFIPFFAGKNRSTWVWGFWLIGTIAVVAGLDLTRQTNHLFFIRYILLAGPAIYALIPAALARWPSAMHVLCASTLIACCFNLPTILKTPADDVHQILFPAPGPKDLLLIAAAPEHRHACEDELLCISRYLPQPSCPVAILTQPADAALIAEARHSRLIFLVTETTDYQHYLPGSTPLSPMRGYHRFGNVWTLTMDSKDSQPAPAQVSQ